VPSVPIWRSGANDGGDRAKADDTCCYVGDVVEATETDDDLAIKGRFDLDTEFRQVGYQGPEGRRVSGLSNGYAVRNSTKTAAGNELTDPELIEDPIVARGANDPGSVSRYTD
jgi:hypothetical protein